MHLVAWGFRVWQQSLGFRILVGVYHNWPENPDCTSGKLEPHPQSLQDLTSGKVDQAFRD